MPPLSTAELRQRLSGKEREKAIKQLEQEEASQPNSPFDIPSIPWHGLPNAQCEIATPIQKSHLNQLVITPLDPKLLPQQPYATRSKARQLLPPKRPRKLMIFAGAPEGHTLDWATPGLLNHFLDPIASFVHPEALPESSGGEVREAGILSTPDPAAWRSIPLHRERWTTGFSQNHALAPAYQGDASFFSTLSRSFNNTSNLSEDGPDEHTINQFYDHSVAIHGDLDSSQPRTQSFTTDESSFEATDDFSEEQSTGVNNSVLGPRGLENVPIYLSDLDDVPDGKYLLSIAPQTMTVNLIVGVISIAEPRTVRTRWGATNSLVELLVGDETKSGFSVTFWLSSKPNETTTLIRSLRRQDIILLRNVALGVFTNKVYGHSLSRGHTKVHLLHRRRVDKDDIGGVYSMKDVTSTKQAHPQLLKTRKVWEWLSHFVGDGGTSLGKRRRNGKPIRRWDLPPADTQ